MFEKVRLWIIGTKIKSCARCGKSLPTMIWGYPLWFCSQEHADEYYADGMRRFERNPPSEPVGDE